MARRKKEGGEPLEPPEGGPLDVATDEFLAGAEDRGIEIRNPFPVLECPASGKAEKAIDPPIPVALRDPQGHLVPGLMVGMECHSGIAGGTGTPNGQEGRAEHVKCPRETLYVVEFRFDAYGRPLAKQDIMSGSYRYTQLVKQEAAGTKG